MKRNVDSIVLGRAAGVERVSWALIDFAHCLHPHMRARLQRFEHSEKRRVKFTRRFCPSLSLRQPNVDASAVWPDFERAKIVLIP